MIEKIRKDYSTVSVLTGISPYLLHQLDRDRLDAIVCPDPFDNRNDLDKFFVFREPSIIWNWDVGAEFRISIKKPGLQGLRP